MICMPERKEIRILVPINGEGAPYTLKVVGSMGKNCIIESDVNIGYNELTKLRKGYNEGAKVWLGDNVHIRTGSIIYSGCKIGNNVHIGHDTILREFTTIGDHSSIGSLVMCEGYTTIGHHTVIHSQCNLTAKMRIGNYVFFGPNVMTSNDRKVRYCRPDVKDSEDCGPIVADGVVIGTGAIILPQVVIKMGAIIGAGAVV
ncbi:unnamed protein product, partial [marine sediment metagenome]